MLAFLISLQILPLLLYYYHRYHPTPDKNFCRRNLPILLNMSVIPSLLLFLLCISMHACNARRLGAIGTDHDKKFLLPNKSDEKDSHVKTSVTPKFKPSLSNQLGEDMMKQSRVGKDDHHKPLSSKAKEVKGQGVKISGAVQSESHVSVSWLLPRKKRGEQQPGFNLDYSPPKTHPPVHN